MNIDTGKLSLYTYDIKEVTIQRYDSSESKYLTASLNDVIFKYKRLFYVSVLLIFVVGLVFVVTYIINKKKKEKKVNI